MRSETWKIQLLGEFRVASPDGQEIEIPSRKASALFALLALNDGIALSRETLCSELWPGRPRQNQQQSLRQAIKDIKEAFAPCPALDATRDTCRIDLEYVCDALECLNTNRDAGKLPLLPDMPEPIFDSFRSQLASNAPLGEIGDAVRGANAVVEWTLLHDPGRGLEMLSSLRTLLPNLSPLTLEGALRMSLEHASSDHPLFIWGKTHLASALMWLGRWEEGIEVAKEALDRSSPQAHASEWVSSVRTAATFLTLRGKFATAKRLLDAATDLAKEHQLEGWQHSLHHGHALLLGYSGDLAGALQRLRPLVDSQDALIHVHLACYHALSGNAAEARACLDHGRDLAGESPPVGTSAQLAVAESYVLMFEGRREVAREAFVRCINLCETNSLSLVRIHAIEGLALLEGNRELLAEATQLRLRHRFPLLPGDRLRLSDLLPS